MRRRAKGRREKLVAHTFWPNDPNPGALMGSLTTWGLLGMVIGGKQLIAEKARKQ
ncbi:hypothetical protein [Ellagibacter isourolithinifaciens]|uniref:hypothetical protein n=1 Tax=Ellagibacter isourolithinifaciens TaxID=2137581 RepID=UPI003A908649